MLLAFIEEKLVILHITYTFLVNNKTCRLCFMLTVNGKILVSRSSHSVNTVGARSHSMIPNTI